MDKESAYRFLNNCNYEIAEVVCNVVDLHGNIKADQSILVLLVEEPKNVGFIKHNKHFWECDGVEELLSEDYPMNFHKVDLIKEIKEFETDF